ncbi:MAG: HlyD family efflux transporter periplasmic adaptor subunit [Planctomycetes bacterium]|nr:HlyD family efflux transporter periplasmic adaptor subunit [Planctomycetota bacterium]
MNNALTNRRAGTTVVVVAIISLATVLGTATLLVRSTSSVGDGNGAADRHVVRRGAFDITVPASGELAALKQIEIHNRLETRAVITEITEEGKLVKAGDILLRFNDEELRSKTKDAEEAVIGAQNDMDSALADLEINENNSESEVAKAQLKVELADLALKGWREGEVVTARQDLALAKQIAEMNFNRLQQRFEASERLYEKEFISLDEFKQDEIALVEAEARLKQTELDSQVYEKYTYVKERKQKESDLRQAQDELVRVQQRQHAEVSKARSNVVSKQRQLASKQDRLKKYQQQLEYCTITAPQDGLVVHATSLQNYRYMMGGGQSLQVGTELYRNQLAMVLPDTSQMVAEVKVTESLSGLIEPGQRAIVTSDALPDVVLRGEVLSIGVMAQAGGWSDPNRRDYTVKIKLTEGNDLGLKPSMRCTAEINVRRIEDSLFVPIQAVFRTGPLSYVYLPQGSGFAQRRVQLGEASELFLQILDGLTEGDVVLLREPTVGEIVARLDEEQPPAPQQQTATAPQHGSPDRPSEQHSDADQLVTTRRDP